MAPKLLCKATSQHPLRENLLHSLTLAVVKVALINVLEKCQTGNIANVSQRPLEVLQQENAMGLRKIFPSDHKTKLKAFKVAG